MKALFLFRPHVVFPIVSAVLIALVAQLAGCSSPPQPLPATRTAIPPTAPAARMPPAHDWILVDLPPGATQLEYGAEVYRLVCRDCHGDHGQGLTAEWRATWAPQDQNCWQSKCHAANHPPDGFILPVAPAIAGPGTLSRFGTAQDLHDFIQSQMPWYAPRSLTEKDGWAVTAYVLKMNQVNPGADLNAATAAQINLH